MSGPKRNPDKLNTIGIVVVGICGAVLVYVSITALQAFYMNDTSDVQTMADYGGNDTAVRSIKTTQISNITEYGANAAPKPDDPSPRTYRTSIDDAMKAVVVSAKADPALLIPTQGPSDKPSVKAIFGRPQPLVTPAAPAAPAAPDAAGSGAGSATPAPAAAAPAAAGSAAAPAPAAPAAGSGSAAKGNGP